MVSKGSHTGLKPVSHWSYCHTGATKQPTFSKLTVKLHSFVCQCHFSYLIRGSRPNPILSRPSNRSTLFLFDSLAVGIGLEGRCRVTVGTGALSLHVQMARFHSRLPFRMALNHVFGQSFCDCANRATTQSARIALSSLNNGMRPRRGCLG